MQGGAARDENKDVNMFSRPRKKALFTVSAAAVAGTIVAAVVAPSSKAGEPAGRVGAESAGDRLFPKLGNGGYDAGSYDVKFDYRPSTPKMDATVTMRATARQDLSRFSLDSAGQEIKSVSVQGARADFHTSNEKLTITPKSPVRKGQTFSVRTDYRADRSKNLPNPSWPSGVRYPMKHWVPTEDGFALMGQPDRAHLFFPGNDHPSDKARFTFRISTPKNLQAAANGSLISRRTAGDRTTYTFRTRHPIPTHVVQVAVGKYREVKQRGPHGLSIHSYVPADQYAQLKPVVGKTPAQVAWLEKEIGRPFPFEAYGMLAVKSPYNGVALETATLSTFSSLGLNRPAGQVEPVMAHELVHQYFGDAVSVRSWDDMWISEGHAHYYQKRYEAARGFSKIEEDMRTLYEHDAKERQESGPAGKLTSPSAVMFNTNAPGALMLHGLRNQVGDWTFRRIEQSFFDRYRNKAASTQDYIDVANKVSGRDLAPYIKSWLYDAKTPPMPGHPDWKSKP
ncbi:Aminopeptidase N (plasmid) [Streptomyces rimosus subsp. rimosus]|nr:M1 family aminopeptidase [Streptomyces rimosus]UNZ08843.1 Aminopeptidase N [Streptomyces rimosus subsp. rimosus]